MKLKFVIACLTLFINLEAIAAEDNKELSYTGTFDVIDKEGDDKTALFGIEHKI